jgi:predicted XRE-type DNA-binding protein
MRRHFMPSMLEPDTHKVHKIQSIRESGHEPVAQKLLTGVSDELACFVEGELVDKHYDSLTNYCRAGEPRWSEGMPEEVRQKVKERTPSPEGRTHSEKTKKLMSKVQRGESGGTNTLTRKQAREVKWYMRSSGIRIKQEVLAEEYGISPPTLTAIKNGKTWSHVDPKEPEQIPKRLLESDGRLREGEAAEIKWLAQEGYNQRQIEEEYGVGTGAVSPIKNEENWTHVEPQRPETIPAHFEKTYTQLTDQEAAEAKWLLENGYCRQDIGDHYGVTPEYVYCIRIGKSRPDLDSVEPEQIPDSIEKTRLTEGEAAEIKHLAQNSEMTQPEIGEEYGVDRSQVSRIKRGKRWGSVDPKQPA